MLYHHHLLLLEQIKTRKMKKSINFQHGHCAHKMNVQSEVHWLVHASSCQARKTSWSLTKEHMLPASESSAKGMAHRSVSIQIKHVIIFFFLIFFYIVNIFQVTQEVKRIEHR